MKDETNPIPDLLLERVALDELDEDMRRVYAHRLTSRTGELNARVQELHVENERILQEYPVALMTDRIQDEARRRGNVQQHMQTSRLPMTSLSLFRMCVASSFAAAAVLLLVWWSPVVDSSSEFMAPTSAYEESVRLKGLTPGLTLWLKGHGGVQQKLKPAQEVRPGDALQIAYQSAAFEYGVIASLDGRGDVFVHFPSTSGASTRLTPGPVVLLDHAYELDDAPDFERFFFFTSHKPLSVEVITAKMKRLYRSNPSLVAPTWSNGVYATDFILKKTNTKKVSP